MEDVFRFKTLEKRVNLDTALLAIFKMQRAVYIDEKKTMYSSSSYQRAANDHRIQLLERLIKSIDIQILELETKING